MEVGRAEVRTAAQFDRRQGVNSTAKVRRATTAFAHHAADRPCAACVATACVPDCALAAHLVLCSREYCYAAQTIPGSQEQGHAGELRSSAAAEFSAPVSNRLARKTEGFVTSLPH